MKESKILITGANGFVGSFVVKELKSNGYTNLLTPKRKQLDLLDAVKVRKYFEKHKPDAVIHLAATVGGIGANKVQPGTFFYDNMLMGLNVVHQAKESKVKKVVFLSTVCSYPKHAEVPFKESEIWKDYPEETNAPYGVAKKALALMGDGYHKEFGLDFVTLVPVNMAGERDDFDLENSHVIPAMIRKFQTAVDNNSDEIVLWGDGSASREFLYAGDCAEAIRIALEKDINYTGPINIGTNREIYIKDLAERIAKIMKFTGNIVWDVSKPNGQPRRCLDVSLAKQLLGFEAKTDLDTMLKRTIKYWNKVK